MKMVAIGKPDFISSVQDMIHENLIYDVKQKHPGFAFDRLFAADELRLDYDIALLSPTTYLLPPRDSLIEFTLDRELSIHAQAEPQPCIILGIQPYDPHAVKFLDAIFTGNRVDPHYRVRREITLIIGIDCLYP
jgi:sulfhydrogenase subunit beta (sulfur reductase)